ncbi:ACP S-malonyltransferase [Microbacterium sp. LRZ72]|uniref:ACP S-malonyltransferase n=1 Tax=Microbacterium sp. LRZ72 TaxID=2942481 RepID=UPI0029A0F3B6|nr:ACP S-malonyltransferase [Microbacterium sp. LRZ72]MDX2375439.1 ACP S-malonyltransferase [Microbacterium sp. LRZ72]
MIVLACPGQGSQTPGFLAPWIEQPAGRERIEAFADAAGVDLVAAGTTWDADAIRDTKIAQPLIVAAGLLAAETLAEARGGADAPQAGGVAGHSVGEITALVLAGVLSAEEGMRLVGVRGRAMADAAALEPTGMSAVVGGDEAAVLARIDELSLTPANHNGAGQIVAAGSLSALAELAEAAPRGARVIPLQVAGAFHTAYMSSAVSALQDAAADVTPAEPRISLWSNRDGSVVGSGDAALHLLVGQVASPVRWDLCMAGFADAGITGLIELAPAGTLVGLAKRGLRGVPTVAVKTPEDIGAAVALLQEETA